jgi:transcriptional regulator of acetoin/glycerol metabolism
MNGQEDQHHAAATPGAEVYDPPETVDTQPAEPPKRTIRVAYLVPLGATGERVRIGAEPVVIGRLPQSTVQIDDPLVSAEHAVLQATGEGVRVCDLGSTNGTYVDEHCIQQASLTTSVPAVLTFGRTICRLVLGDLEDTPLPSSRSFGGVVGRAPAMLELFALLGRVAPTRLAIFLHGEPGTGKDLLAHAIHAASGRGRSPFVSVHAAGVRADQLFGDVRAASPADRSGLFGQAEGGTLYLSEVGELSRPVQKKLCHVLETRQVRPVGGKPRPVDVRILTATSSDLHEACRRRRFRSDLLRRISEVRVEVPALRDRREDFDLLAGELCDVLANERGLRLAGLHPDALPMLRAYDWPGNVRELKQVLEQALAEAPSAVIQREALERALRVQQGAAPGGARGSAKEQFKRRELDHLVALYHKHEGNLAATARDFGCDRHTARVKLRERGVYPWREGQSAARRGP